MSKSVTTGIIATNDAPTPAGHYSQGVTHGGLVYISGQLPISVDGRHNLTASFEDQVRLALGNILKILRAAGCSKHNVIKVTAYVVGSENWPTFNQIYSEIFGESRPARVVVPVPELHYGYRIEIDAIGAVADVPES